VQVRTADLDANSRQDIVACCSQGPGVAGNISVILNRGQRDFRPPAQLPVGPDPRSIGIIDIEQDGDKDIAVLDGPENDRRVEVLRNDFADEQLQFAPEAPLQTAPTAFTLLISDVDQDLHGDILAVGTSGGDTPGGILSTIRNPCDANCDLSGTPPVLNVQDFACFLNKYAAGEPEANCDGSTTPPILNVQDFACFLNKFAAGCP
jgi:hypothetical protein